MAVFENENLRVTTEAYISVREEWIGEAVEAITGDRETPTETVLFQPTQQEGEAREDSINLELSPEKEHKLREIAGRFGIGGEQNVTLAEAGLPDGHIAVIEGGLVWKMVAELAITGTESTLVFSGTKHRETNDRERQFASQQLELTDEQIGATEYDLARNVAEAMSSFVPVEEDEILPFGYDIHNNHTLIQAPTGQLVRIGTLSDKPVLLLAIDRQPLEDGRYEKQPDTAAVLGFISDVLVACGDHETAVGMITSNTYASRVLDAVRAGHARGNQFGIAMYGRHTLAMVKDEAVAKPTAINQIPSELRVMYDKLQQLKSEVSI